MKDYSENDEEASRPDPWAVFPGTSSGDPHPVTVDGLSYNFQAVGEFQFATSDQYDLQIQTRFVPNQSWSILDRVAMWVNEHVVEFGRDGGMLIDGSARSLPLGAALTLDGGASVEHRTVEGTDRYYVYWRSASQDAPVFSWTPRSVGAQAGLYVPQGAGGDLQGLMGNADGNPMNDFRYSDGTQLSAQISDSTLHGAFADSWRITDDTSLFTYGSSQNTSTFTNQNFPPSVITIHNLTADQITLATEVCTAHNVAAGPQFDDCIVDVALTSNTEFAAMAAQRKEVAIDPNAATTNAAGNLSIDFETDPIPTNVIPARLTNDGATTTFAGPYAFNQSYRFYAQSLPAHLTGTLTFDLIALGDWNSDPDQERVTAQIDRNEAWSQTFGGTGITPQRSGVLDSGQPYRVYTVSVPFTHSTSQVEAIFSATGVDGLANHAFGIDNINLHVDVIPPQTFDVALPFAVSDGSPAPGAGNLETKVSQDQYRFTVAAGQALYVDVQQCPGSDVYLAWKLVNETSGALAASGNCFDTQINDLPAGTYRLVVSPMADHAGTFKIALSVIPAPQVFDVSVPATISDGAPGPGAGNLETKASRDDYRFTVAAGQSLYVDVQQCPGSDVYLSWLLINDSTGVSFGSAGCYDRQFDNLPAGTYRLTATPMSEHTGPYKIALSTVTPPQVFDVSLPATISDGAPGPGAGNLETKSSQDEYRFTVAAGQSVYVDVQQCPNNGVYLSWKLINDATGASLGSAGCYGGQFDNLSAGTYRLVVTPALEHTGTYKD